MRPVSQERPSDRTRGKASRKPARGITRGTAAQPRSSKRKGGFRTQLGAFFGSVFSLRRPMVLLTLLALVLIAAAVTVDRMDFNRTSAKSDALVSALISGTGFGLAKVHLEGNARTRQGVIMAALQMKAGQSIFGVDLQGARDRLLALPWVAEVQIQRRYPDGIVVAVAERVPYARWQTPSGLVVVERSGRVIAAIESDAFVNLPLLIDDGAPEHADGFVEAVAGHRSIVSRVEAYQYQSRRRWNLILDNGIVVKLPETGWDVQLKELDKLIVEDGILETNIREIDLRPASPFYFVVYRGSVHPKDKPKAETGRAI